MMTTTAVQELLESFDALSEAEKREAAPELLCRALQLPSRKRTLEELLRSITPENLHGEWDTGPAVGRELL
jgi:hypothetical protein